MKISHYLLSLTALLVFTSVGFSQGMKKVVAPANNQVKPATNTVSPAAVVPATPAAPASENQSPWTKNMVKIEGDTFSMGAKEETKNASYYEKPLHTVKVNSFYMGKYEVTVAEFEQFVKASNYKTAAESDTLQMVLLNGKTEARKGMNWRYNEIGEKIADADKAKMPVTRISYVDAVAYCDWLSKQSGKTFRMPTEAEWEFAAKGGKGSPNYEYACGSSPDACVVFRNNSKDRIQPVGSRQPGSLGIYDLNGNVFEWCSDWYSPDYYKTSPSDNPQGPAEARQRVIRGGEIISSTESCKNYKREHRNPKMAFFNVGFRVVMIE